MIYPKASDGFTGHAFAVWGKLAFDSSEEYALQRDRATFDRLTGKYIGVSKVYVLVPRPIKQTKNKRLWGDELPKKKRAREN